MDQLAQTDEIDCDDTVSADSSTSDDQLSQMECGRCRALVATCIPGQVASL